MSTEPGTADDGEEYCNAGELWQRQQAAAGGFDSWYCKAVEYWDGQEASYNAVLGGYGHVSDVDVRDSRMLLEKVMKSELAEAAAGKRTLVALDCGAGVGRISQELLLHLFQQVDLLEPSGHLLKTAENNLKSAKKQSWPAHHHAVNFYQTGLQQHIFEPQRYDVIWIQWCLLYLTDEDAVSLFRRCGEGLRPNGYIFVKENICKKGFIVDKADSSLTRSNAYMLEIFAKGDLELLFNIKQRNFPKEIFDVRMYVLQPKTRQDTSL